MYQKRIGQDEKDGFPPADGAGLMAETLRAAGDKPHHPAKTGEEGMSLFWRVFGGTILSIVALVGITVFNNLTTSISELRAEVNRLNEARAELVKKDEFNTRMTSSWDRVQNLQAQNTAQNATLTSHRTELDGLKERVAKTCLDLDGVRKDASVAVDGVKKDLSLTADTMKKDLNALELLKERVAALELIRKEIAGMEAVREKVSTLVAETKAYRDDFSKLRQDVDRNLAYDHERKAHRDEQYKGIDKALKDLQTAVQECRVKVALLEGQQVTRAAPPTTGRAATKPKAERPAVEPAGKKLETAPLPRASQDKHGGRHPRAPRRSAGGGPFPVAPGRRLTYNAGMERINKYLAHAGIGSRRQVESLVTAGRVKVNGIPVTDLGTRVDPDRHKVTVDDHPVRAEKPVYWAVNKPVGYLCTNHDPAGRPRAVDLLPHVEQRVYTVGRLDEGSEGLLLMTNDGDLAEKLMHPRYEVEKTYLVLVAGQPSKADLDKLLAGVWLSDGKVRAKKVRRLKPQGDSVWLRVVLCEGKNREIRRMLAKLGHKVMRLRRTAIGPVELDKLPKGKARRLGPREVAGLQKIVAAGQEKLDRVRTKAAGRDGPPTPAPAAGPGAGPGGRRPCPAAPSAARR